VLPTLEVALPWKPCDEVKAWLLGRRAKYLGDWVSNRRSGETHYCTNNSNINRIILVRESSVVVLNSPGETTMLDLPIKSHHCDASLLSDSEFKSSITD